MHLAIERPPLIEETRKMNKSDRGTKYACPDCATKYYDLKKDVVLCPNCGAKPPVAKMQRSTQPARRTGRTAPQRFR